MEREPERGGWPYYAAIVLFAAVLAFAVLGLVRSTSRVGAATGRPGPTPTATPRPSSAIPLVTGPASTPEIPPPSPSAPTQPPSRTFLYRAPAPETTAPPEPAPQPRR